MEPTLEITLALSKTFGIYFLIASAAIFFNRKALMIGVESMFKERFAQLLAAMISILGGLAFVNFYQDWSNLPSSILSFIGWLIIAKGLLYAFLPEARIAKITKVFTERSWYTMDAVITLVVGIYLTGFGFGFW